MDYLDVKLDEVNQKLEQSALPQKSDETFIDEFTLALIEG